MSLEELQVAVRQQELLRVERCRERVAAVLQQERVEIVPVLTIVGRDITAQILFRPAAAGN